MTPPLFVIRIGAFSFDTSILSVSVRAQCPVVCLGDLKRRPVLLAVPEAAGQQRNRSRDWRETKKRHHVDFSSERERSALVPGHRAKSVDHPGRNLCGMAA